MTEQSEAFEKGESQYFRAEGVRIAVDLAKARGGDVTAANVIAEARLIEAHLRGHLDGLRQMIDSDGNLIRIPSYILDNLPPDIRALYTDAPKEPSNG
jgi:hypothetical protein